MELVFGLATLLGVSLLVQSKPLPSPEDYEKAKEKLITKPDDPDANTVVGKYLAFVNGDYQFGMQHLAKSSDKVLSALAKRELDEAALASPQQKQEMADEWVNAAKKFQPLAQVFYDRAGQWYAAAWPSLDDASRAKLREFSKKLVASRPPGASKRPLPQGWSGTATIDGTVARSGSYSMRLPAGSVVRSELLPVSGKVLEISAHIRTDGTDSGNDRVFVHYFDANGVGVGTVGPFATVDLPFWKRVASTSQIPQNIARIQIGFSSASKQGVMWVDDVSLKVDGVELIKNPSFEGR